MGLSLEVGLLADLKQNDPEGCEDVRRDFEALNKYLVSVNLPPHIEPEDCEVGDWEMFGYSGLHYLRRYAAYFDSGEQPPGPGDADSSDDRRLKAYGDAAEGNRPGRLARAFGRAPSFARRFDHLIIHSDAEGYYLPQDFEDVLFPGDDHPIPGGMIGSAFRLLAELEVLAADLSIPNDVSSESDALWDAADEQGEGETKWQRFGVESFTCVALLEACRHSLRTGAALVFV